MLWLYDMSTISLAGWFAAVFVGFTWLGVLFIRPFFRLVLRRQPGLNDIVGVILSSHCAFFGLLLGLLAVAAYQNLSDVEKTVNREAGYLRSIYRSITDYPEPTRSQTLPLIREYTRFVIEEAWPQQRRGIISSDGVARMNAIQANLFGFEPATKAQEMVHAQTLGQFAEMAEVRRARIQSVDSGVPPMMWYVVIVGALITILLVWMLDMKLLSHLLLSGVLAFFLSTVICLIFVMDKPFRGEISIGPDAYAAVYKRMNIP
ncbi:MAG: DUF4239 domain-containing protein [Sphingomonadales bacterium]|nr:DUF4239 domain-containing protein [Sphingomonadales bacterium]